MRTPIFLFFSTNPRGPITERQMMIGVSNQLQNERYLGSMKPFSEGEPGSLGNRIEILPSLKLT